MGRITPDALRAGNYIIVTPHDDELTNSDSGFFVVKKRKRMPQCILVLEVNAPFIVGHAVGDGDHDRGVIDLRDWEWYPVSKRFGRSLDASKPVKVLIEEKGRIKRKREKPDPRDCPRCGQRMVQVLHYRPDPQWIRTCKQCNIETGVV